MAVPKDRVIEALGPRLILAASQVDDNIILFSSLDLSKEPGLGYQIGIMSKGLGLQISKHMPKLKMVAWLRQPELQSAISAKDSKTVLSLYFSNFTG